VLVSVVFVSPIAALIHSAPATAAGLPDTRSYELVSPLEKSGNEAGAFAEHPLYTVARGDGEVALYGGTGPLGSTNDGIDRFSVGRRVATEGWKTSNALPTSLDEQRNLLFDIPEGLLPAASFGSFAFTSQGPFVEQQHLGEPGEQHEGGAYLTNDPLHQPRWLSQPTVTAPNPSIVAGGAGGLGLAGAAGDLSAVYFTYFGTLTQQDETRNEHVPGSAIAANAWGFYEWTPSTGLTSAGELPEGASQGRFDPFGAVPAGVGQPNRHTISPANYANEVSADGRSAFFVSPDPESDLEEESGAFELGRAPELYLRKSGLRTILVSKSDLPGEEGRAAPHGPLGHQRQSYVYATSDGAHALFASKDKLAKSVTGEEPTGSGPWAYEFDVATEQVRYLPGVALRSAASVVAATEDGSQFVFLNSTTGALEVWRRGSTGVGTISVIAQGVTEVSAVRLTFDASAVIFETTAHVVSEPAYNDGGVGQVYRYVATTGKVACVSCPPVGVAPSGPARLSNYEQIINPIVATDSRGASTDGRRVFFDSPDPLVAQDVNGKRDVYEWEEAGVGTCPAGRPGGCTFLISSGAGRQDSFFLDNSESGNDVFFVTVDALVAPDGDEGYDVYDARAPHVPGEIVGTPVAAMPSTCQSACRGVANAPPTFGTLGSGSLSGVGNLMPQPAPAPAHTPTLTRAQKLGRALKACKRIRRSHVRSACIKTARKRYGVNSKSVRGRAKT